MTAAEKKTEQQYKELFRKSIRDLSQQDACGFLTRDFNTLLTYHIPTIVAQYGTTTTLYKGLKYTFTITDIITYNSPVTNSDCFNFGLSRTVPVTGMITLTVVPLLAAQDIEPTVISSIRAPIVHLPMPTGRSVLYTPVLEDKDFENEFIFSGTFINNAKGRSLPCVKSMRNNTVLLFNKKKYMLMQIRSAHHSKPFRATSSLSFEIYKEIKKAHNQGMISCCLPFSQTQIHVSVLAMAFGITLPTFVDMIKTLSGDLYDPLVFRPYEISILYEQTTHQVKTQEEALIYISRIFGKENLSTGVNQLKTEVFPHINIAFEDKDEEISGDNLLGLYQSKVLFLAKCVSLLILFVSGKIPETCRDWVTYSSIITPAYYTGMLFRNLFMNHIKTTGKLLRRKIMNTLYLPKDKQTFFSLEKLYGESRLSARIQSAFASGVWSATKKGMTIPLNINNNDGFLDQLLRLSSSVSTTDSVHTEPRNVHDDEFGYIDAAATPDGELVGLVRIFCKFATVTPDLKYPKYLSDLLVIFFKEWLVPLNDFFGKQMEESRVQAQIDTHFYPPSYLQQRNDFRDFFIYYNNCGIATHAIHRDHVDSFIEKFRHLRRSGQLPLFTFLQLFSLRQEIHIINEGGQLTRPLIVVSKMHLANPTMSFIHMLALGIIEYVNAAEEQSICKVAPCFEDIDRHLGKVTHVELDQVTMLSRNVAQTPYVTCQQGNRASFASQQKKAQITADPKKNRGSVLTTQMWYGFKPLVTTETRMQIPPVSTGNTIPVVMAFLATPKNEEDAFQVNASALELGLGVASTIRHFTSEISKAKSTIYRETFGKPPDVLSRKRQNYNTIQEDGFPLPRTFIPGSGIVIGKYRMTRMSTGICENKAANKSTVHQKTVDISVTTRPDEEGQVCYKREFQTPVTHRVELGVKTTRWMGEGDKCSNENSGKGVLNIKTPLCDMPFSVSTGVSVDIVCQSLTIASRMTIAPIIAALTGKAVSLSGKLEKGIDPQDLNQGTEQHIKEMEQILHEAGFQRYAEEKFIDGKTGKFIDGLVFTGMVDVARLIQMASKKLHARDTGKRDQLTRQPCEGRRYGGGLRIGGMEGVALGCHGAARILQTRYKQLSDPFHVHICAKCKMIAEGNEEIEYSWCRLCQSNEKVFLVSIPFTFLVTIMELQSMGIMVRIALAEADITKPSVEDEDMMRTKWLFCQPQASPRAPQAIPASHPQQTMDVTERTMKGTKRKNPFADTDTEETFTKEEEKQVKENKKRKPIRISFGLLTKEQIDAMAVANLNNVATKRNDPIRGSVLDARMGPCNPQFLCGVDGSDLEHCPGHFAMIELFAPMNNVLFLHLLHKVVSSVCIRCSRVLLPNHHLETSRISRIANFKKRITEIFTLSSKYRVCWFPSTEEEEEEKKESPRILSAEEIKQRGYCGTPQPDVWLRDEKVLLRPGYLLDVPEQFVELPDITPFHVYNILLRCTPETTKLFGFHPQHSPLHALMIWSLITPPLVTRPSCGFYSENDLTFRLRRIQKLNAEANRNIIPNLTIGLLIDKTVRDVLMQGKTPTLGMFKKLKRVQGLMSEKNTRCKQSVIPQCLDDYFVVQRALAMYMDSKYSAHLDTDYFTKERSRFSLKTRFCATKHHKNIIRENVMGKRVEKCMRGVIIGDTYMDIDEAGIPLVSAMTTTEIEIVCPYNFHALQCAVLNGQNVHPGANLITVHNGDEYLPNAYKKLQGLQFGFKVHRHLRNGDWVLFNRQPSLHKHSILALRAKIFNILCFMLRMELTPCYNADFDGDEMNGLIPCGVKCIAEARELMSVKKNMRKDGRLLVGFVQHVPGGAYKATQHPSYPVFSRADVYQFLVMGNCDEVMDEIMERWEQLYQYGSVTGRQFMSLLLPTYKGLEPLTKSSLNRCFLQYMSACMEEEDYHLKLMGFISRILEEICYLSGLSISVHDFMVEIPSHISDEVESLRREANEISIKNEKIHNVDVERDICNLLGGARDILGVYVHDELKNRSYPCGSLDIINSGAKGNITNITQGAAITGPQLNSEGDRGLTTTSHVYPDHVAMHGFIKSGFLKGHTNLEFFHHLKYSRESLVDAATKTPFIGYLYRKLFMSLGNERISFDNSVRNEKNFIIMNSYGFDPTTLITQKLISPFLPESQLVTYFTQEEWPRIQILRQQVLCLKLVPDSIAVPVDFAALKLHLILHHKNIDTSNNFVLFHYYPIVCDLWTRLTSECLVPGTDVAQQLFFFELMSYNYLRDIGALDSFAHFAFCIKYVFSCYSRAVCEAGSAVGYEAAQHVAEPVTQGALKQFHITGQKTTLMGGVRRLKEIINLVKNIATPSMEIYILSSYRNTFDPFRLVELYLDLVVKFWTDSHAERSSNESSNGSSSDGNVILTLYLHKDRLIGRRVTPRMLSEMLQSKSKILAHDRDNLHVTYAPLQSQAWWITLTCPRTSPIFLSLNKGNNTKANNLTKIIALSKVPTALLSSRLFHALKHEHMLLAGISGIADFYKTQRTIHTVRDGQFVKETRDVIVTMGSNLHDVCLLPEVDISLTLTNDIRQIYDVFGIDATLIAIAQNLYNTMVNSDAMISSKHILLIAHAMTQSGKPSALTHTGMSSRQNPSSFFGLSLLERSLDSLQGAAVVGEESSLRSVSESMAAGTKMFLGTGGDFKLLTDFKLQPKFQQQNILRAAKTGHKVETQLTKIPNIDSFIYSDDSSHELPCFPLPLPTTPFILKEAQPRRAKRPRVVKPPLAFDAPKAVKKEEEKEESPCYEEIFKPSSPHKKTSIPIQCYSSCFVPSSPK